VEFSVNTNALTGLADMLDRRWRDYETGRTYLKSNAHFSVVTAGVLNAIFGSHQKIVNEIDLFLSTAAQGFAGPCSTAVVEAGALYRHSDRAAVVRNDAAMPAPLGGSLNAAPRPGHLDAAPLAPAVPAGGADQSAGPQVFADLVCPGGWFRPPPDHHADHPFRFTFFDAFSPTSWARDLIWNATDLAAKFGVLDRPYDVLNEAVEPLCGDWAGYLRCADVYDNLAGAIGDTARCIGAGERAIAAVWTGNAAQTCADGLAAFTTELDAAVDPLHQTAATYRNVAESVYVQAEAVAAILTLVCDDIVESAMLPESGGLLAPVQVTTEIFDLMRVAEKIREVISLVSKAHELASASMDSASSALSGFGVVRDAHPVPVLSPTVPALPSHGSIRAE
jgi:hypothetical protein